MKIGTEKVIIVVCLLGILISNSHTSLSMTEKGCLDKCMKENLISPSNLPIEIIDSDFEECMSECGGFGNE